jgi:hypothetical protein
MNFRNERQYDTQTYQVKRVENEQPSYYSYSRSPKYINSMTETDDSDKNTIIYENFESKRISRSPLRISSREIERRTIIPIEEKAYLAEAEPGISNLTITIPRESTRFAQGSPKNINLPNDYYDYNTRTYVPNRSMNQYNDVLLSKRSSGIDFRDSSERFGSPVRTSRPTNDTDMMRSPLRDYENSRRFIESMRSPGRNKEMVYVEEKRYYIQDELGPDDTIYLVLKNSILHVEKKSKDSMLGRSFRKWKKMVFDATIEFLEKELRKKPREVVKEIFQEVIKEIEVVKKEIVTLEVIQQVPLIQHKIKYIDKNLANLDVVRPVAAENMFKTVMKQRLYSIRSRLNRMPMKNHKETILKRLLRYSKGYDTHKMLFFRKWKECTLKLNDNKERFKKSILRSTKGVDKKKISSFFNKWRRFVNSASAVNKFTNGFNCFQMFVKRKVYDNIMPIGSCDGIKKRVIIELGIFGAKFKLTALRKALNKWKQYMTWIVSHSFKSSIFKNLSSSFNRKHNSKLLVQWFTRWRRLTQTMRQDEQLNQTEMQMKKMAYKRLSMQISSLNRRLKKEGLMKYFSMWKLVTIKVLSVTRFQGFLDMKRIIKKNLVSYAWTIINSNSRKSRINRLMPVVLNNFEQRNNIVKLCWAMSKWLRYISFHRKRFKAVVKLVKVLHLRRLIISAEIIHAAFVMKKFQDFSRLVLLKSGFNSLTTCTDRQKMQLELISMCRKGMISNICSILKRSNKTMKVVEMITMCFKHKEIARKKYKKEIIKRWKFIVYINNFARKKMELMYSKIQDTYMNMASELIENEQDALLNEFEQNEDDTLDFKDILKKTSGNELKKKILFDLESGIVLCEDEDEKKKNK